VEALLNSGVIGLVISLEFARKNKFRKKKLDSTFNYKRLIKYIVEIELLYRGYKERIEINVIEGQKWSVILRMLWLACHNLEINWKMKEVKIERCPYECRKQWKTKQTKPKRTEEIKYAKREKERI